MSDPTSIALPNNKELLEIDKRIDSYKKKKKDFENSCSFDSNTIEDLNSEFKKLQEDINNINSKDPPGKKVLNDKLEKAGNPQEISDKINEIVKKINDIEKQGGPRQATPESIDSLVKYIESVNEYCTKSKANKTRVDDLLKKEKINVNGVLTLSSLEDLMEYKDDLLNEHKNLELNKLIHKVNDAAKAKNNINIPTVDSVTLDRINNIVTKFKKAMPQQNKIHLKEKERPSLKLPPLPTKNLNGNSIG